MSRYQKIQNSVIVSPLCFADHWRGFRHHELVAGDGEGNDWGRHHPKVIFISVITIIVVVIIIGIINVIVIIMVKRITERKSLTRIFIIKIILLIEKLSTFAKIIGPQGGQCWNADAWMKSLCQNEEKYTQKDFEQILWSNDE